MSDNTSSGGPVPPKKSAPILPAGGPDLSHYADDVAAFELTDEQAQELLLALWRIMSSFVDRAWGDDPVQHVHETQVRDEIRRAGVVDSRSATPQHSDKTDLSSAFASPAAGSEGKEQS